MAIQFKVPAPPKRSIETIEYFRGADFTNSPAAIGMDKSPNCKNMIRSTPGKVRKSMGWKICKGVQGVTDPVYGYHKWSAIDTDPDKKTSLIHIGYELYKLEYYYETDSTYLTQVGSLGIDFNKERSYSWEQGDKLFIIDGYMYKAARLRSNNTIGVDWVCDSEYTYVPTVTISKDPNGGGTPYEDLNLLNPAFTEQFLGQAGVTEYQLSFTNLDPVGTPPLNYVTAKVLQADGTWSTITEGLGLTVDRQTGTITFTTAPGASPITGEDNVKITAYRTVSGYADRINKCTFGITYGGIGGKERLFLSGNPDYPNYDWFSAPYDFTYFADTSYSRLGNDGSAIMGYAVINNNLVTFKDENDREQNAIVRTASKDSDNKEIFVITNSLQGVGAISKDSFGYLAHEPLFLTSQGIFSITTQDVTGDRYMQLRSFFLNGKLLEESNLKNAVAFCYNDYYILAINGVLYILDGLQGMQTDKSAPYSTRQYAGFYRTNVPANVMWEINGVLWFGTPNGKVCRFFNDVDDPDSYADNGEPIEAIWETPDIDGELFYKNKTLRYLAVRVEAAVATSIKMYAMERGLWNLIKFDERFASYFSFENLIFSKLTFSCDKTQKISKTKVRLKKVDKFRLRFVNDVLYEPFSLFDVGMEYVEKGNFKG